jgi:hypothetical protein
MASVNLTRCRGIQKIRVRPAAACAECCTTAIAKDWLVNVIDAPPQIDVVARSKLGG